MWDEHEDGIARKVWLPEREHEPSEDNCFGRRQFPDECACDYVKGSWGALDWPMEIQVNVIDVVGNLHRFDVVVEQEPVFRAHRREDKCP